jgi:hypothetical protein
MVTKHNGEAAQPLISVGFIFDQKDTRNIVNRRKKTIMGKIDAQGGWQRTDTKIFWGEIAPCDHVVQIYEDDEIFLDMLAGFAGNGINAGDCVIIIATAAHLNALEQRLVSLGVHVDALIEDDRYIALDAEKCLSKFMANNWPDEERFTKFVSGLLKRAHKFNRQVRAFGEMVAILWAQGHNGATVQLEHLWNKFCDKEALCLFCAYPKSGFTQDINESIKHICATHSKIITGTGKPMVELLYRDSVQKTAV